MIGHRHADRSACARISLNANVELSPVEARRRVVRRLDHGRVVGADRCLASARTSRFLDDELVLHEEAELQDRDGHSEDEGQDQDELDGR